MSLSTLVWERPRSVEALPLALGEMWTSHGLVSVAEAVRVLDLRTDPAQPGGALLLDAEHIPRAHVPAPEGLVSIDPAALLAAGEAFAAAAVVLWLGGDDLASWGDLEALTPLVEALGDFWQVLDVVIRPVGHQARSTRYLRPCPVPQLGGFRVD